MQKTIELDIPTPITAAVRRVMHLTETGYITDQFKADLQTLMQAAMAWEVSGEIASGKRSLTTD